MPKKALILVDLQNDFCKNGSLEVPNGDEVIAHANQLQQHFDLVIATQDWHPQDHMSFASNQPGRKVGEIIEVNNLQQVMWPDHCVQNTKGAELHPKLETKNIKKIIYKGTDKTVDSYSAFFDNAHIHSTGLAEYLRSEEVDTVYIMGLATDYCVKFSCLDAVDLGFTTYLIEDASRGVNLQAQDVENAVKEMQEKGVRVVRMQDF